MPLQLGQISMSMPSRLPCTNSTSQSGHFIELPLIRDSPDDIRSGVDILTFWTFLQSSPRVQAAAGTSGGSNGG
jgi:hypothetical protein